MAEPIEGLAGLINIVMGVHKELGDTSKTACDIADLIRDRARENYRATDPDVEMEEFTSRPDGKGAWVEIWEGTMEGENNPNQAIQIEYGDATHDAQPFLRPAIDEIASDNPEIMKGIQTRIETHAVH
jgi:hypothetical protein